MPVILKLDYTDGTTETIRIPAELWRHNASQVTWQHASPKTLRRAEVGDLVDAQPTEVAEVLRGWLSEKGK